MEALAYAGILLVASSLAFTALALGQSVVLPAPDLGLRGYKRHRAMQERGMFRTLEPVIRKIASWIAHLPLGGMRRRAQQRLVQAGDHLGLSADEWFASCLLGAFFGAAFGMALVATGSVPMFVIAVFAIVGVFMPYNLIIDATATRRREIKRDLPITIDIISLAMSAGMTFTAAVADVIARWPTREAPMREELGLMLRRMELGHSRAAALRLLAERVPLEAVRDFSAAVMQSEDKGTPLRDVLAIQAEMMRARASLHAEEAAVKAAMKMLIPLTLLLLATFVIIAGPLILRTQSMGL